MSTTLLPPVYNQRAPAMWQIVEPHVDWPDVSVLDVGCGRGDLAFRAAAAGAQVTAFDGNDGEVTAAYDRMPDGLRDRIRFLYAGEQFIRYGSWDVVFCFSVLPYVVYPTQVLDDLSRHAQTTFIECQYAGDGPGFVFLEDDDDMATWLAARPGGWSVERLGATRVEGRLYPDGRPVERAIWKCE